MFQTYEPPTTPTAMPTVIMKKIGEIQNAPFALSDHPTQPGDPGICGLTVLSPGERLQALRIQDLRWSTDYVSKVWITIIWFIDALY